MLALLPENWSKDVTGRFHASLQPALWVSDTRLATAIPKEFAMTASIFTSAPLKPIPIEDRPSVLCSEPGHLDVLDGAFVAVDKTGVRAHIPVGWRGLPDARTGARESCMLLVLLRRG
jgi:hypothetical protein